MSFTKIEDNSSDSESDHDDKDGHKSEDNDDEEQGHRVTVRGRIESLWFWKQAEKDKDLDALCRATRPLPQDPMAGLHNVVDRVFTNGKFVQCAILLVRMLFNVCMNLWDISVFDDEAFQVGDGQYEVKFTDVKVRVCDLRHSDCAENRIGRLMSFKVIIFFEVVVGVPFAIISLACLILFLCHCEKRKDPKHFLEWPQQPTSWSRFHRLPYEHPWFFMFAPRMVAGFSGMIFLNFLSPTVFRTILLRGDYKLQKSFIMSSIMPNTYDKKYKRRLRHNQKRDHKCCHWVRMTLLFISYFALFFFSLQALVIKLTTLYFVFIQDFRVWTPLAWMRFIAFINQIIGSFEFYDPEWQRLLLFNFGQSNCAWDKCDIAAANIYLRLLNHKIVEKITIEDHDSCFGRLKAIALMSTFNADDMQKMFLSPAVEKRIFENVRTRERLLKNLYTGADAEQFFNELVGAVEAFDPAEDLENEGVNVEAREKLESALRNRKMHLELLREKQLDIAKNLSNSDQRGSSENYRLASVMQAYIEDLKDVRLEKDDAKLQYRE